VFEYIYCFYDVKKNPEEAWVYVPDGTLRTLRLADAAWEIVCKLVGVPYLGRFKVADGADEAMRGMI
jgi:hypothetical protein